ncbi:MAG TPA: SMP-30/gluconolactonase/LRE family protein [Ktedonobacterales bacterium]|nr:SMP-30/gluconolactonase/LRE family protein [Ktedonobacterales bacterium]
MSDLEHLLAVQNELGEGPVWDTEAQTLFWVDGYGQTFYRFVPATGALHKVEVGVPVGSLAPRISGGLVLATQQGFALWDESGGALTFLGDPEADHPETRFNDGAVDPAGRFWAGTMLEGSEEWDTAPGNLYRLDADHTITRMETGLAIANGIGWSPDYTTMYLTDSPRQVIYAYDYDLLTGAIEHRRPFIQTPGKASVPDGLTVDSEGCIWSARWGGWRIVRYDPQGKPEREIVLPVQYPTSCTFGGPALDELYITSAAVGLNEQRRKEQPLAGDLFRIKSGIKGLEKPRFLG